MLCCDPSKSFRNQWCYTDSVIDQPRFERAALSIAMNAQNKKLLRTIIKQVHPDVMTNYPLEQLKNSESLKASVRLPGRYVARCFDT